VGARFSKGSESEDGKKRTEKRGHASRLRGRESGGKLFKKGHLGSNKPLYFFLYR
jgi:hypothetical protein